MARGRGDVDWGWYHPDPRAILPLTAAEGLPQSRSHQRLLKRHEFTLTLNTAFAEVMAGCRENRDGCWIADAMIPLYAQLNRNGFAHSIECWQDGALAGGLYGVAIGGVFCGESMFSRVSGASKVALLTLLPALHHAGYRLFDTQFVNDHLRQFGVQEIAREDYLRRLQNALTIEPQEIAIGGF